MNNSPDRFCIVFILLHGVIYSNLGIKLIVYLRSRHATINGSRNKHFAHFTDNDNAIHRSCNDAFYNLHAWLR